MDLHWSGATLTSRMAELTPAVWGVYLHLHLHHTNPHPSNHLVGDWLDVVCYVMLFCLFKTLVWSPETRLFLKFWDRQLLSWINRRCQRVETKRNCWNHKCVRRVLIKSGLGYMTEACKCFVKREPFHIHRVKS